MMCTLHNKPRTGNRVEPSPHHFLAEGSDKRLSTQYLRPNIQPIYQLPHSSLAPPRNPPGELFITQPVADLFQPRVCALPFQIGERSEEHTSELQSRENLVC